VKVLPPKQLISDVPITPTRTSKLEARRNLEEPHLGGNDFAKCSFNSFSDCTIIYNISKVGVSLGSSSCLISRSVNGLKELE
jgi:hypothetical protein